VQIVGIDRDTIGGAANFAVYQINEENPRASKSVLNCLTPRLAASPWGAPTEEIPGFGRGEGAFV
jgi:hypothetical protein